MNRLSCLEVITGDFCVTNSVVVFYQEKSKVVKKIRLSYVTLGSNVTYGRP